ncbi:glycosyl transferase family 9 (putative heptosyltransferase) [Azospirillum brasilense]|uniref:Glycosyl transferase family 9 (Putative heptosyltransferase) n=1 Tax=Azospirillum brasilense TaxID=192 RepID=A0A560BIK4_AZOBR|nr:tetratricopeptide repeat-containing glycosyltransferase family protein [Azospirillum brasilense]TWA72458.1 glycosyl transferase family 9 (putative heptosyltransferase) [Azospirillum brasilense]
MPSTPSDSDLCEIHRREGRLDEAVFHGRRAVALDPGDAACWYNLGVVLYERLEVAASISCERRAVRLRPDWPGPHFELAEGLLLSGQWEEGWREYEWRWRLRGVPPLVPPSLLTRGGSSVPRPWDGSPLPEGTLLLIADQGFGDTVQFARYLPMAAALCRNLVVACSPEIRPVIRALPGGHRTVTDWAEVPPFDAYAALSGLPGLFGTAIDTVPPPLPGLRAEPERVQRWTERLNGLLPRGYRRVGLVWAGRLTHGNDRNRSLTLAQLAPFFALEKTVLVSIQKGPAQAEAARYYGAAPLVDLGPELESFADTMAVLGQLDHVVCVDTAVAHLAGAMGRPTAVLLPHAPDWRWLLGRGGTPWYPTVTLHRQPVPGQWDEAIRGAVAAVARGRLKASGRPIRR